MYFSFLKCIPRERSSFDYKTADRFSKYLTNLPNIGAELQVRRSGSSSMSSGLFIEFIYLLSLSGDQENSSRIKNRFKLAWCSDVAPTWSVDCFSSKLSFEFSCSIPQTV